MRYLAAFGRFWYDFVIGDDPKIAIAVVTALAITGTLLLTGAVPAAMLPILGGVLVAGFFTAALLLDVRGD